VKAVARLSALWFESHPLRSKPQKPNMFMGDRLGVYREVDPGRRALHLAGNAEALSPCRLTVKPFEPTSAVLAERQVY